MSSRVLRASDADDMSKARRRRGHSSGGTDSPNLDISQELSALEMSPSALSAEQLLVGAAMPVAGMLSADYTATAAAASVAHAQSLRPGSSAGGSPSIQPRDRSFFHPEPEGVKIPPCDPIVLRCENLCVDVKVTATSEDGFLKRMYKAANELLHGRLPRRGEGRGPTIRRILSDVSVEIKPCRLVALMGASGAGKSTLLNALSRRRVASEGRVLYNGVDATDEMVRGCSVFIQQQDIFIPELTVREHLRTQLRLRLGAAGIRDKAVLEEREEMLTGQMSLVKCRDTLIGPAGMLGSISGGERKRLNVTSEIATLPSVLFADEPTTGLDSFMACAVIKTLRLLGNSGRTIVTTIHQPSSSIFELFDDLLLLAEGRLLYFGDRLGAVSWLEKLGYQCPPFTNPSDFIIKTISMPASEEARDAKLQLIYDWADLWAKEGATFNEEWMNKGGKRKFLSRTQSRCDATFEASLSSISKMSSRNVSFQINPNEQQTPARASLHLDEDETVKLPVVLQTQMHKRKKLNWFRQVRILYARAARSNSRNKMLVHARFFQTIIIAIVLGTMTLALDWSEIGARSRVGGTYAILMNQSMTGAYSVINTFTLEKPIIQREYESGLFSPSAYILAKFMADTPVQIFFPIIFCAMTYWMMNLNNSFGAFVVFVCILLLTGNVAMSIGYLASIVSPAPEVAGLVCNLIVLPLTVYGGFMVRLDQSPVWLSWIQYFSFTKWGLQAGLHVIFRDRYIETAKGPIKGYDFINASLGISMTQSAFALAISMLAILLVVYRVLVAVGANITMKRNRENA